MSTASHVPRWGLFGGTFDPPHRGHLAAAKAVRERLGLDKVVMMVAREPWQKADRSTPLTPAATRVEMVKALVNGVDGLEVGEDEVRRGGPTFTVDTLREWHATRPGVKVFLVLGADAAANLGTWKEPHEVLALSTLVVVSRPGVPLPVLFAGAEAQWVEMEPVDVSSSAIRNSVAGGGEPDGTTAAVARLIADRRLYRGAQ